MKATNLLSPNGTKNNDNCRQIIAFVVINSYTFKELAIFVQYYRELRREMQLNCSYYVDTKNI